MMNSISKIFIAIFALALSNIYGQKIISPKANIFIGTGGHGHTYPGATVPFGMVQLSPDTRLTGWDGCSGYHYSDSVVYGFSHTHLSGTGVSDYSDFLILPIQGKIRKFKRNKPGSHFKHSSENAYPGFYHTYLDDYGVDVDLTTTERCGFHKYTFKNNGKATIFLDLKHRDFVKDSGIKIIGKNRVEGYRYSSAWATDQKIYFSLQFSQDFDSYDLSINGKTNNVKSAEKADSIKAFFNFILNDSREILVKVGISSVDIEGARKNLAAEIKDWDFDNIKTQAKNKWKKQFDKIKISGGSEEERTIFYSAFYHVSVVPNLFSDIDGRYRGMDGLIHSDKKHDTYTVFSLWDTYRATHPLYTLIEQKRTSDFINTFIGQWEQSGKLPVWELAGNETNCMIGIHSIPVISDAVVKNIKGFDINRAYTAMKSSIEQDKAELNLFRQNACITAGEISESVSKTLEYSFDEWNIAQVSMYLGEIAEYRKYITGAQFYKNVFDPNTRFMRPRQNGGWRSPFNPSEVDFNYTEANSWQYSFYVPQDVNGLIEMMGGNRNFIGKLDTLFSTSSETTGRHQADISGLIGQYAHGNEPSHHMAYLYNYADAAWKTQKMIRRILKEMYQNEPDGLSGNEDCGQMSAWYVFSAMGFYPVCPGSNDYIIGSPLFDSSVINVGNGKSFTIKAVNNSPKNIYIQSATLNGKPYNKSYISHFDIIAGGKLELIMGDTPNQNWPGANGAPKSSINKLKLVPSPYVVNSAQTFYNRKKIELKHIFDYDIYYSLDNGEFMLYKNPFYITKSTKLKFFARSKDGERSYFVNSAFYKLKKGRSIKTKYPYNSQYTGGGSTGLIDQIKGSTNFSDMTWQGYQGTDFEAVVDLGKLTDVNKISAEFLQSANSWIWLPEKVVFFISQDGKSFEEVKSFSNDVPKENMDTVIKEFTVDGLNKKAKYVKVFAKNIGVCPKWHPGAGGKAWLFIDEITVE